MESALGWGLGFPEIWGILIPENFPFVNFRIPVGKFLGNGPIVVKSV